MPYSVPEDYFKSFKSELMKSLPEYPEKPQEKKLTVWQRFRPYVYLAAMFAGIWCMMQIFHRVSTPPQAAPAQYTAVAERPATTSEPDDNDFYVDNAMGLDIELEDELADLYPSVDDFKRDFYAAL